MLYKGSNKIGQVYKGNTKIGQIYKGSTLIWSSDPYEPDYVVYERTTAGTETINILGDGKYEVYCIAGGGGGSWFIGAGSGSGFIGIIQISKGELSVICGAGAGSRGTGGNSSIGNYIKSYGGKSGKSGGAIPTISATVISTTLNVAGNAGGKNSGGAAVYESYGKGGGPRAGSGTAGYIKIVYKGQ